MAREDKSQTGARTGIGREVEGIPGAPRDEGPYRSRVGLDRVLVLDAQPESESDRDLEHAEAGDHPSAPADRDRTRTLHGSGDRAAAQTSLEVDPSVGAGEYGADIGEPTPPDARPRARPAPPIGKSTPGLGTSIHARHAGEHARAHTSIEASEQEDRATRSAAVRGSAAKPVRAAPGGDAHEGARDRRPGGARMGPRGVGAGTTGRPPPKKGASKRAPRT